MSFILEAGSPFLLIIGSIGALFIYRVQAAPESRIASALVFIFAARFGSTIIGGFTFSGATESTLGQVDTIFAYLMLAFAFFEVLLLKNFSKWRAHELWFITGIFGFGFMAAMWKLTVFGEIIASDLLHIILILIVLALHPTSDDLRFLPYFGASMIFLVTLLALAKYQNPFHGYSQLDYGRIGPYGNRIWDFFGLDERFRGPYQHPNQLGIQITFLSMLTLLKSTKLYLMVIPFSYLLLLLASSRTSILALTCGLLLKIYFDLTENKPSEKFQSQTKLPRDNSSGRSILSKVFFGSLVMLVIASVARQIVGTNVTGSGRLDNYAKTISIIRSNSIFGGGPSIFMTNNTENTLLTIISYYGVFGFLLLSILFIAGFLLYRGVSINERIAMKILLIVFLIASLGEALLTGAFSDSGTFYLLMFLTLSRRGA